MCILRETRRSRSGPCWRSAEYGSAGRSHGRKPKLPGTPRVLFCAEIMTGAPVESIDEFAPVRPILLDLRRARYFGSPATGLIRTTAELEGNESIVGTIQSCRAAPGVPARTRHATRPLLALAPLAGVSDMVPGSHDSFRTSASGTGFTGATRGAIEI